MSEQRVGTCSLCGGSVIGVRGAWHSINPPPPDRCSSCGAVAASDVIEMRRRPPYQPPGPSPYDAGNPKTAEALRRMLGKAP